MKRASDLFSPAEIAAIENAISDAERATAAEIVPIVATASGRYDRAEDSFGLCCAMIALACTWMLGDHTGTNDWADGGVGLGTMLVAVFVAFIGGAAASARFTSLRLPFVARSEMLHEVERSAREMFQRERLRATTNGGGVLIYVSLYEHLVRIIADDAAAAHLPDAALEAICAEIVDGLKRGEAAAGVQRGILKTGELLAPLIPANDTNELPNRLVLIG